MLLDSPNNLVSSQPAEVSHADVRSKYGAKAASVHRVISFDLIAAASIPESILMRMDLIDAAGLVK